MCRIPRRDARLAPAPPRSSPLHSRAGLLPPWRARRAGVAAPSGHGNGPTRDLRTGAAGRAARVWYPSGSPRSRRSSLSDDRRGGPRSPGVPTPSGPVAQLAEQQTLNLLVEGSTPSRLTNTSSFPSIAYSDGPCVARQSNRHPRLLAEGSSSSRLTPSSSSLSSGSTDSHGPTPRCGSGRCGNGVGKSRDAAASSRLNARAETRHRSQFAASLRQCTSWWTCPQGPPTSSCRVECRILKRSARQASARRRTSPASASAGTTRCADSATKPLVMLHTWKSWRSTTPPSPRRAVRMTLRIDVRRRPFHQHANGLSEQSP